MFLFPPPWGILLDWNEIVSVFFYCFLKCSTVPVADKEIRLDDISGRLFRLFRSLYNYKGEYAAYSFRY